MATESKQRFFQLTELVPLSEVQTKTQIGEISDGYHTFNELYHYRMLYNALIFNEWAISDAWAAQPDSSAHNFGVHKSKKHSDGKFCFDADGEWFVVVATLPTGQISNHYHNDYWDLFQIPVKEKADKWDGHSPKDVAERIEAYIREPKK